MPPEGVSLLCESRTIIFAAAKMTSAVVMNNLAVIQQYHGVAWVRTREWLANNHIARPGVTDRNSMKSVQFDVFQVKVFAAQPPTISPVKIRQVYAAQVIGVAEERVTINHSMLKATTKKMRNRAVLNQSSITSQPPRQACHHLRPSVCSRKDRDRFRV